MKRKSLYARITLAFVCLISILAIAEYLIVMRYGVGFLQERDQRLNRDLAQRFAVELTPLLQTRGGEKEVIKKLLWLEDLHPAVDIYVLDASGEVLYGLPVTESVDSSLRKVDLKPVQSFILPKSDVPLPLFGVDPVPGHPPAIFSATEVSVLGERGYLYVLLHGHRYSLATTGTRDYHALVHGTLAMGLLFVSTILFGALMFHWLTRRFSAVTMGVDRIARGDLGSRICAEGEDELGQLAKQVNAMVDTLCEHMDTIEQNDQTRRDLVANIAHDLATPLTSIGAHLDMLQDGGHTPSAHELGERLPVIQRNVVRLRDMAGKLFELSKLEAKDSIPRLETFDVLELVEEEILPKLSPQAKERAVHLHTKSVHPQVMVVADVAMIERVLSNLVENAIRYHHSKGGEVLIRMDACAEGVVISVEDNGPGISAGDVPHVFDRFYRGQAEKRNGRKGTGLGLAIVKKILALHHSEIILDSETDEGTTFSFTLPSGVKSVLQEVPD